MKIENFNPGILTPSKNLYFFDGCIIEYFEGVPFKIFGSIDVNFIEGEIDLSYFTLNIVKDENGKTISLADHIRRDIEKEFEDKLETLNVEI
jgi:hypothetical protein